MTMMYTNDNVKNQLKDNRIFDTSSLQTDDVMNVLVELTVDYELVFFDYFHPQWSDPGAYVTVRRYKNNFVYMLGNHGWSSPWYATDINRLCRYIMKNKDYQNDSINIRRSLRQPVFLNEDLICEKYWFCKLNLVHEVENQYKLYEVNGYHVINILSNNVCYAIDEEYEIKVANKEYELIFDFYSLNSDQHFNRQVEIREQ